MDNIFIERLWRSLKYEAVYLHGLSDGFQAQRVIARFPGVLAGQAGIVFSWHQSRFSHFFPPVFWFGGLEGGLAGAPWLVVGWCPPCGLGL